MWVKRDPRIVYDGQFLKTDLLNAYDAESRRCTITYLSSDTHPVSLTFDDIAHRLFAMSFDPYNCVELRWGNATMTVLRPVPTKRASGAGMRWNRRRATRSAATSRAPRPRSPGRRMWIFAA